MLWMLLSLFAAAALAPLLHRLFRSYTGVLLALCPLAVIGWSWPFWKIVASGAQHRESFAWAPTLSVNAAVNLDGLSLVFLLLICGIGSLVLIYASEYLRKDPRLGQFYAYLLLFMGSMLGVVLADNVFVLFLFWELTSVSSFLLIGWNHENADARHAARTSLIVTGGGGMLLLAGLVLLTLVSGKAELSEISGDTVRASPLYLVTLILILGGAFTKSAQFPFHFWLPGAMAAPTPVSAYLHSATMVKAGIYLLARLHPTLGFTDAWYAILTLAGGLTMLIGATIAVTQTDLKRILAYSTVSVLGILTMLLGIGTAEAILAAMVYLVAHSLYKGALFLIAGVLDHETGSRDITQLRGLAGHMPLLAFAAVVAAASSAGVPPMFGFISKELFYEATWHAPSGAVTTSLAAFVASLLMVVVALLVCYRPFFGGETSAPHLPHGASGSLLAGPIVLALGGLIMGDAPGAAGKLLGAAATAVRSEPVVVKLALWHGLTPLLGLSALTLLLGFCMYRMLPLYVIRGHATGPWILDLQRIYDGAYAMTMHFAAGLTRVVQNGYLRNYILIVVITLLVLLTPPILQGLHLLQVELSEIPLPEGLLALMILVAALSVTVITSRLAVAAALGVIGIAVMLLYVIYGALDLAVTQIMVETLMVILLVLVLFHLPRFRYRSFRWLYLRDALISLAFAAMITMLVIKASAVQGEPELQEYYAEHSYQEAHGRNVVNVILVDFRATDTLGEVTVLAVAAIGVYALFRFRARRGLKGGAMISLVLRTATPVLMLLLLVVSVYALLRGHHESGGGFIGGLLAAAAFSLHALAHNVQSTRRLLGITPQMLMGLGLMAMLLAGAVGLGFGTSFLQGHWMQASLPGLGMVYLGTPLLFDAGVYAVVMGMVLTIILAAAEE